MAVSPLRFPPPKPFLVHAVRGGYRKRRSSSVSSLARTARTGSCLPEDARRTLGGAPLTLLVNCTPPSGSATSGSLLVRTTTLQQTFTTVTSQHMRSWHLFLFLTPPHLPHYNRSATRCFNCLQHSVLFPSPPEKCPVYITGPGLMLPCR